MEKVPDAFFNCLCWVCLTEDSKMYSIFDSKYKIRIMPDEPPVTIYDILLYTSSCEIWFEGGPVLICDDCKRRACISYKFKKRCEAAVTIFNTYGLKQTTKELFLTNINASDGVLVGTSERNSINIVENNDLSNSILSETRQNRNKLMCDLDSNVQLTSVNDKVIVESPRIKSEETEHIMLLTNKQVPAEVVNNNGDIIQDNVNSVRLVQQKRKVVAKTVWCTICKKEKPRHSFNQHMATHANKRPHACTFCPKKFNDKTNLIVHIRIHTGEHPYICEVCGKTFAQSTSRKIHMRMHNNIKPYKCHLCTHTTTTSSHLRQHIKRHNGTKNHKCDQCDYSACTKGELTYHLATHSNNKCHICKICEKGFTRKKSLKVHEQSHSGNKPYICTQCGRGFTQAHSLRSHVSNLHRTE